MRLVRDVFIPFSAFPVAARSSVPAYLFYFSAGRVNNEICPVPLFSGLHKQLILLSCFSLNYTLFPAITQCRVPAMTGLLDLDS